VNPNPEASAGFRASRVGSSGIADAVLNLLEEVFVSLTEEKEERFCDLWHTLASRFAH
jgi:hypothetical protein